MILSVATCRLQIIFSKDDQAMRELLVLNEYKPVLEICTTNVAGCLLQVSNTYNKGLGWRDHNVVAIVLQKTSFLREFFFETESSVFR
jgi:hypothetical protein